MCGSDCKHSPEDQKKFDAFEKKVMEYIKKGSAKPTTTFTKEDLLCIVVGPGCLMCIIIILSKRIPLPLGRG